MGTTERPPRCLGLKFCRPQVICSLIVDFYCAEKRLVVELDGDVHDLQQDYDQQRDAVFRAGEITVLRIRNEQLTPTLSPNKTKPAFPFSR